MAQSSHRLTGTVVRWLPDKGFGFILGKDGVQYFFHRSAVNGPMDDIQEQVQVTFVQTSAPKGPRAEDVQLD